MALFAKGIPMKAAAAYDQALKLLPPSSSALAGGRLDRAAVGIGAFSIR
ncbi:hypothetical protein N8152_02985 [bacterium]|nr:hypothetical protein [bacterium]